MQSQEKTIQSKQELDKNVNLRNYVSRWKGIVADYLVLRRLNTDRNLAQNLGQFSTTLAIYGEILELSYSLEKCNLEQSALVKKNSRTFRVLNITFELAENMRKILNNMASKREREYTHNNEFYFSPENLRHTLNGIAILR